MSLEIVEGWTGAIEYKLLADKVAVDLSGTAVVLVLNDKNGAALTPGGTVTVFDAVNGKVRYSPAASELTSSLSPISARWKVTDGAGKIVFFPNADPISWIIGKA